MKKYVLLVLYFSVTNVLRGIKSWMFWWICFSGNLYCLLCWGNWHIDTLVGMNLWDNSSRDAIGIKKCMFVLCPTDIPQRFQDVPSDIVTKYINNLAPVTCGEFLNYSMSLTRVSNTNWGYCRTPCYLAVTDCEFIRVGRQSLLLMLHPRNAFSEMKLAYIVISPLLYLAETASLASYKDLPWRQFNHFAIGRHPAGSVSRPKCSTNSTSNAQFHLAAV